MPRSNFRSALRTSVWFGAAAWLLAGCSLLTSAPRGVAPAPVVAEPKGPDPKAPRQAVLETRHLELAKGQEVIGETQLIFARYENTFSAIGRQYNLGYEEMRSANPGVDQWLPGEGTPIYLPTQSILPEVPREGIVVNVPAMRLYYFTTEKAAEQGAPAIVKVTSHPIGIGVEGWATPFGEAKVTQKVKDPVWYVPASIRKEHADRGDPLPSVVKAGPDNPLGAYALTLSLPSYLIHGTNKPAGVGMRSSHGCIRLYPEDIEALFSRVPRGTAVRIVNQPVLAGWRDGQLYLEVHPPLAEEQHDLVAEAESALRRAMERNGADPATVALDHAAIEKIVTEQRGIPLPVVKGNRSLEQYLASVRIVENTVPVAVAEETARLAEPPVNATR
ncbi:MAG TPA: L,D-transpeptidase family protein [Gammaproteobacteria bacterium]|nr:L,D-transpeptidase family protein [Gammaproteobacteria bacterium]